MFLRVSANSAIWIIERIACRDFRFLFLLAFSYNSRKNFKYSIQTDTFYCFLDFQGCGDKLGMESGTITASQITSSSNYNEKFPAHQARLNNKPSATFGGCWKSGVKDYTPWLCVDLGKAFKVVAIGTQGNPSEEQWVTHYTVRYGHDGKHWAAIYSQGMIKVIYKGGESTAKSLHF